MQGKSGFINSYIALDTETTGINPKADRIIEIAALKVVDGEIKGRFEELVYPGMKLDKRIEELTSINDGMLEGKPLISEVIGGFTDFSEGLPLLGHRIIFDYSFIKRAAVNASMQFEREGIDTLNICRHFMPEGESRTLSNACGFYGIDAGRSHRAMSDAMSAHLLYQKLAGEYYSDDEKCFKAFTLIFNIKKERPAGKRQKERLQNILNYHKIQGIADIDSLTMSEASRMTDRIISVYGKPKYENKEV